MQSSLPTARGLHVALIPDGNGRWATRRGLPRSAGHLQGLRRVEESVAAATDLGVEVLSLFAFSRRDPGPAIDGEPAFGTTPVTIQVVPQAVQVVVP